MIYPADLVGAYAKVMSSGFSAIDAKHGTMEIAWIRRPKLLGSSKITYVLTAAARGLEFDCCEGPCAQKTQKQEQNGAGIVMFFEHFQKLQRPLK